MRENSAKKRYFDKKADNTLFSLELCQGRDNANERYFRKAQVNAIGDSAISSTLPAICARIQL